MRGSALSIVVGAGLLAVGAGAVVAPKPFATMFGLPTDDPVAVAYLRATGVRDAVLGGLIFAVLDDPEALRRTLRFSSVIALADAGVVAATRGPRLQHVFHLGGFALFVLASLVADDPR